MRKAILLFCLFIVSTLAFGQANSSKLRAKKSNKISKLDLKAEQHTVESFLYGYYEELGLVAPADLKEQQVIKDYNGWKRVKFKQSYMGIPVQGSAYTLHQKDGVVQKATGVILPNIEVNTNPSVSPQVAKEVGIKFIDNIIFSQRGANVTTHWHTTNPELVIIDVNYPKVSGNYSLAYKFQISDERDHNHPILETFYVDAHSGLVIQHLSNLAHTSVEGIANTSLYGEQTIIAENTEPGVYILVDSTRGDGVITKNGSGQDFTDDDNYWNNYNVGKEQFGGDAHYCATSYYDMMKSHFDWDGIDGNGKAVISWVSGSERNYVNAYWNGTRAFFGSGDCDDYDPLTSLTVVGHEFAHGFTEFTSGLIYRNESGAMNESISDCIGKALEYEYDYDNFTWLIGDKFLLNEDVQPFRSMSNPNDRNDPKYYGGIDWYIGAGDAGGVHSNSGVFNYWFHLLVDGVSGTNEVGYEFDVAQLGMDKTFQIVFSMNTGYLTEGSGYLAAMLASLEVCEDLYGPNSAEEAAVIEAWRAVGITTDAADQDVQIELIQDRYSLCRSQSEQAIDINLINVGLNTYPIGEVLEVAYSLEAEEVTSEFITLDADFEPGDTIVYTYLHVEVLPDVERDYELIVTLKGNEINQLNNTDEGEIEKIDADGDDLQLTDVTLTKQAVCNPNSQTRMRAIFRNLGCKVIVAQEIPAVLYVDGMPIDVVIDLPFDLRVGSTAAVIDDVELPIPLPGVTTVELSLNLATDEVADNNFAEGSRFAVEVITEGYHQTFDQFLFDTDPNLVIDPDNFAIAELVEYEGEMMIGFSGEDPQPFRIEECDDEEIFFRENYQLTEIEFCANTEGMMEPKLSFDMIQFRADEIEETNLPAEYGAMLKVYLNDSDFPVVFGQTEGELVYHEYELPLDYNDEIKIEVITLSGNKGATIADNYSLYDFVLLDNLKLFDSVVSTENLTKGTYQVFPNPGTDVFTFKSNRTDKIFDLIIYDNLGRMIAEQKEQIGSAIWNTPSKTTGIHFYTIIEKNGSTASGKFVIE